MIAILMMLTSFVYAESYGTYRVPVPADLEPYATFEMPSTEVVVQNDLVRVSYDLPVELVGTDQPKIELNGRLKAGRLLRLRGPHAKADCVNGLQQMECTIEYDGLNVDLNSVEQVLLSRNISEEVRAARLKVATLFSTEPVGIVTIKKN